MLNLFSSKGFDNSDTTIQLFILIQRQASMKQPVKLAKDIIKYHWLVERFIAWFSFISFL